MSGAPKKSEMRLADGGGDLPRGALVDAEDARAVGQGRPHVEGNFRRRLGTSCAKEASGMTSIMLLVSSPGSASDHRQGEQQPGLPVSRVDRMEPRARIGATLAVQLLYLLTVS